MAGGGLGNRRPQPARSVSRLRSTLLLRRSSYKGQKYVSLREDRSGTSSSGDESDNAGSIRGEEAVDSSTPEPEKRGFGGACSSSGLQARGGARESDSTLSSKSSSIDDRFNEAATTSSKREDSRSIFKGLGDEDDRRGGEDVDDPEDEGEEEEEEAVIDAVLAFQRWRQHNLKRSFSQELKKVLEEARRDEASLTSMQRELMKKDVNLVRAQAESAQLRAHILAIEEAVQQSQSSSNTNEEARKEVKKAQERAAAAEEEVYRRDREIVRLKQRLKCIESEKVRVDENMQANLMMLQQDKAGILKENRAILDQLSRKDEELTQHINENTKLQSTIASMAADHQAMQARVAQEQESKSAMQKEVNELTRKCELLEKEKECLNIQLEKMLEKLNSITVHDSAQCSVESQSRTSEAIAAGILEHLRILTNHMIKLEASFGRHSRGQGLYNSLHKIDVNLELALKSFRRSSSKARGIGGKLQQQLSEIQGWCQEDSVAKTHCVLNQTVQTDGEVSRFIQWLDKPEEKYLCVRDVKTQTSGGGSHWQLCVEEGAKWLAWKWRWLSTALEAKLLSKQLKYSRPAGSGKVQGHGGKSCLKTGYNSIMGTMERELRAVMGETIVRIFVQLWRTYRRSSKSERKALSKTLPLDNVLAVFPWWIRRVGEKRRAERCFSHWYYLASCSARRQGYQVEDFYLHPHSCYTRPYAGEYQSVRRKVPKFKYHDNSSDGNAPQQQGLIVRKKDLDVDLAKPERRQFMLTSTNYTGSTFTARALRTLQVSLQQEFQDLQQLLAKEMEASQVAVGHLDSEKSTQRRRMTFLWEVCNNLANALMDAHKQLVSLDREFNLRVSNYLELSANSNCEPKHSPRARNSRAKSPIATSRALRQIDEIHPVLRFTDDYPVRPERKNRSWGVPAAGYVNVTTRKPSGSTRKKACIASQCAAILQSEARRYGLDKFDKGTMVQEDGGLSPRKRPPWTR